MCNKRIFICVLTSFFFLLCAGSVIAADFDHSMKFTSVEISAISSMGSPMYATVSTTEIGDSMKFTRAEIDVISAMGSPVNAIANVGNYGDSMTFTRAEIDSIAVPCNEYC